MIYLIPFFVIFINETLKVMISFIKYKKFDLRWFLHPGGMPSGHSAFVSSCASVVFLDKGIGAEFMMSVVFAIIVMYDSRGVRFNVGLISKKVNEINNNHDLEEITGHTNFEVFVGCVFGILLSIITLIIVQNFSI